MKKAVAWTAIAKYTTAALQLVFAAILSRILTPEQFGIVAVIGVFIVFFQLFCDMGFGTAVIQDKELSEKQINDIFSWTIYMGIGLMLLFVSASFPISIIYEDPIYIPLGAILSISLLFNALNMIPNAVMLRQKQFKSITIRTIVSSVVSSILTIILAIKGWGVYALVLQSVFTAILVFIWNEVSVRLRFSFTPSFSAIKRIWGYSLYQFLSQLLNYFNRNLDSLLIGKFFSKSDLGQYNKSYHLMQMPIIYIPGVVGPALHPILSEHQNNPSFIYNTYIKLLKLLSLIGCFVSAWLFFTGKEIMLLLFGGQWIPAIIPFKILALSVWFQLATNTFGPIYQSIGNTKLLFKNVVFSSIIIVSLIIVGCSLGNIRYVAICVSIGYVINYFVSFYILTKFAFKKNFGAFLRNFWQEVVIFAVLFALTTLPLHIDNLIISFITKTLIILTAYVILLIVTKQHKHLLSIIPDKYRKRNQ